MTPTEKEDERTIPVEDFPKVCPHDGMACQPSEREPAVAEYQPATATNVTQSAVLVAPSSKSNRIPEFRNKTAACHCGYGCCLDSSERSITNQNWQRRQRRLEKKIRGPLTCQTVNR